MTNAYDTIEISGKLMRMTEAIRRGLIRFSVDRIQGELRPKAIYVASAKKGKGRWTVSKLFYDAHTKRKV